MRNLLEHKSILVAGAGGLLGSRLVCGLLAQGANVIAADINIDRAKDLFIELGVGVNSPALQMLSLDITNADAVKKLFSTSDNIDGAVNSTYPRNKTYGAHFFDVTLDSFNENVSLHLGSSFLFSQQCAAYFVRNRKPFSLVNVSSIYGVVPPDFSIYKDTTMTMAVEYAAIKSALLHLNKYVASYIDDSRFRVNCVSPGGIFDHQPEVFLKAYKEKTLGTGMLDVDSIVGSVLFLLSDQSRYVVGQNIVVDDGFTL